MPAPTVTLEDVLALMDADWHWKPEHKALVLAAAGVVATARRYRGEYPPHLQTCTCSLCASLAAFDKISKGEPT